jgi:hypothetical protein
VGPQERDIFIAGIALGVGIGVTLCVVVVVILWSNFLPSKGEKRLLGCMNACPYPFGTPEFDTWVAECVSKPGRPGVKSRPVAPERTDSGP